MTLPEIGDNIYIKSSFYISRGSEDVCGGLATISEVKIDENLEEGNVNKVMVGVDEISRVLYNWKTLLEKQEDYEKLYAGRIAHRCPDIDTP